MLYLFTEIEDASTLSVLSNFRTGGTSRFFEYAQLGLKSVGDSGFLAPPEVMMGDMSASQPQDSLVKHAKQ